MTAPRTPETGPGTGFLPPMEPAAPIPEGVDYRSVVDSDTAERTREAAIKQTHAIQDHIQDRAITASASGGEYKVSNDKDNADLAHQFTDLLLRPEIQQDPTQVELNTSGLALLQFELDNGSNDTDSGVPSLDRLLGIRKIIDAQGYTQDGIDANPLLKDVIQKTDLDNWLLRDDYVDLFEKVELGASLLPKPPKQRKSISVPVPSPKKAVSKTINSSVMTKSRAARKRDRARARFNKKHDRRVAKYHKQAGFSVDATPEIHLSEAESSAAIDLLWLKSQRHENNYFKKTNADPRTTPEVGDIIRIEAADRLNLSEQILTYVKQESQDLSDERERLDPYVERAVQLGHLGVRLFRDQMIFDGSIAKIDMYNDDFESQDHQRILASLGLGIISLKQEMRTSGDEQYRDHLKSLSFGARWSAKSQYRKRMSRVDVPDFAEPDEDTGRN